MTEKELIGRLRERRIQLGVTYRELSALADLPESTIGRLEMRQTEPYLSTVIKYARALGLSVELFETDLTGQ